MDRVERHSVLGVEVCAVDIASAVDRVLDAAERRRHLGVTALAVHGVMEGRDDPEQRFRLNAIDLVLPDGQPVRWALNLLHRTDLSERVYGPDLMLAVCDRAASLGLPIYLYGSTAEVLSDLSEKLCARFPALQIAGARPSLFRPADDEEHRAIASAITATGARICFVGLGCPRQEIFVYEHRDLLAMPLIAVGAAFDFHAGRVPQAPSWMQRWGLEWLFRLAREPRRLWRRYVLLNPRYVAGVIGQMLGRMTDPGRPPRQTTRTA